ATLTQIGESPEVQQHYEALAAAAQHASTPQVRNAATIGGNLLQRPRCWDFRNEHFHHGPDLAQIVRDRGHQDPAIFDTRRSLMVQASTPATALVAYDARVELRGPNNRTRTVPLSAFFLPPEIGRERDADIERGEVLTRVLVPPTTRNTRAAYYKQTERDSY